MSQKTIPPLGLYILGYLVLSASIVGYFVGLQSPVRNAALPSVSSPEPTPKSNEPGVMLATSYSEIAQALRDLRSPPRAVQITATATSYAVNEEVPPITAAEKQFALEIRAQNRAFNGAPPTIPHPVDQTSAESCMACHGEGIQTKSLRAAKMSHPYYANCMQCHAEKNPPHILRPVALQTNSFRGLPAPSGGPRAFPGAPPQVPHSTWMRSDCLSCHGPTGNRGFRTTHPWRQNCLQCHTPSVELEQIPLSSQPTFLGPPTISE